MPIQNATRTAAFVVCSFIAATCFAAEPDAVDASTSRAADAPAPSRNLFTSWFGTPPEVDQGAAEQSRATGLVDNALGLLGISYRFGGNTPSSGFDCSGMVRYVFWNALGLNLPRRAEEISRVGVKIDRNQLQPGDLVFYKTLRRAFSHVGIYLGNNRFIHAPSAGGAVRVDDMSESYWAHRFTGARRVDE